MGTPHSITKKMYSKRKKDRFRDAFENIAHILPEDCDVAAVDVGAHGAFSAVVRRANQSSEPHVLNIDAKDRKHFRDNMEFESNEEIINRVLRSNRRAHEHELLARTLKRKNNLVVALGSGYLTSFTPIAVWLLRLGACIVLVNEFRTSQYCSSCDFELSTIYEEDDVAFCVDCCNNCEKDQNEQLISLLAQKNNINWKKDVQRRLRLISKCQHSQNKKNEHIANMNKQKQQIQNNDDLSLNQKKRQITELIQKTINTNDATTTQQTNQKAADFNKRCDACMNSRLASRFGSCANTRCNRKFAHDGSNLVILKNI